MKKIFCIFAVVLILIMATVPCFAVDEPVVYLWGLYNNLIIRVNGVAVDWSRAITSYNNLNFNVSLFDGDFSTTNRNVYIFVNKTLIYSQPLTLEGFDFSVNNGDFVFISLFDDVPYLITNNLDETIVVTWGPSRRIFLAPHRYMYFVYNSSYYVPYTDSIVDDRILVNGVFYHSDNNFVFSKSDITFDPVSKSGQPIINFYSSFVHLFDPLANITTTYYIPLVIFSGIFFCLIMIFVIAMIIRRCRNL